MTRTESNTAWFKEQGKIEMQRSAAKARRKMAKAREQAKGITPLEIRLYARLKAEDLA